MTSALAGAFAGGDVELVERQLDLLLRCEVLDRGERLEVDASSGSEDGDRADCDRQQEDPGERAPDAPRGLRLAVVRDRREHSRREDGAAVAVDGGTAAYSSLQRCSHTKNANAQLAFAATDGTRLGGYFRSVYRAPACALLSASSASRVPSTMFRSFSNATSQLRVRRPQSGLTCTRSGPSSSAA